MNERNVFVDRMVDGEMVPLQVADWYYQAWAGCYCMVAF